MKTSDIRRAVLAAKTLIARADVVLAERDERERKGWGELAGTKASGALKRVSMELSRTLSTMRAGK